MITTTNIANARLESEDNLANKIKIKDLHSNRIGPHSTPMVNTLAVALAKVDSSKAAAQAFDMTRENVSYHMNHGKKIDREVVKERVGTVHSRALDAMLDSIDLLQPKLTEVNKAVELSAIAANLARVVEKTTPKEAARTNLVVVAYAPRVKEEQEYEEVVA